VIRAHDTMTTVTITPEIPIGASSSADAATVPSGVDGKPGEPLERRGLIAPGSEL